MVGNQKVDVLEIGKGIWKREEKVLGQWDKKFFKKWSKNFSKNDEWSNDLSILQSKYNYYALQVYTNKNFLNVPIKKGKALLFQPLRAKRLLTAKVCSSDPAGLCGTYTDWSLYFFTSLALQGPFSVPNSP